MTSQAHTETIRRLREIKYARIRITDLARSAGLSTQAVYNAINGHAGDRALRALGQALDELPMTTTGQSRRAAS
jgi:hypothetical protein